MQNAAKTYGTIAKQIASPREIEAGLLLKSASRLQAIDEAWEAKQNDLGDALLFNRRLWTLFLTAVTEKDNPLPIEIRQNVANIGLFVIKQTMQMMTDRTRAGLGSLININRELAAGLLGR